MKCPKCNKEIEHVDITSGYGSSSVGYLKGNKIAEYEMVEGAVGDEFSEIISIECPECGDDISDSIAK